MSKEEDLASYLINLPARTDRLKNATERLGPSGLLPEIVIAYDFDSATSAGVRIAQDFRGRRPITRGDLGCIASHLEVYRRISALGDSGGLIFEDDILPVSHFGYRIRRAMSLAPQADIIQFGWLGYDHKLRSRAKDLVHRAFGQTTRDRLEEHSFAFGTHCYWVSTNFADFALDYFNPAFAAIDIMIESASRDKQLKVLRHWPPLAIQDDTVSDINVREHGAKQLPKW